MVRCANKGDQLVTVVVTPFSRMENDCIKLINYAMTLIVNAMKNYMNW